MIVISPDGAVANCELISMITHIEDSMGPGKCRYYFSVHVSVRNKRGENLTCFWGFENLEEAEKTRNNLIKQINDYCGRK